MNFVERYGLSTVASINTWRRNCSSSLIALHNLALVFAELWHQLNPRLHLLPQNPFRVMHSPGMFPAVKPNGKEVYSQVP